MKKLIVASIVALAGLLNTQTYPWWSNGTIVVSDNSGVVIINGQVIKSSHYIEESGQLKTKIVDISNVNSIQASSFGHLTIEYCPTCEEILTVIADKNIMPHIK